jgi:hypothetical protein
MQEATEAQIKQWKKEFKEIYAIEVIMDDEGTQAIAYFRKPTLDTITAADKFMKEDPLKGGDVLFENCWIGGEETIKGNDEARLSCMKHLGKLFQVKVSKLKKL